MEATGGFEPPNRGFADLRLSPLGYVAPLATRALPGKIPAAWRPWPRWCRERDLNPHGRNAHGPLKTACLPIPPPRPVGTVPIIPHFPARATFSARNFKPIFAQFCLIIHQTKTEAIQCAGLPLALSCPILASIPPLSGRAGQTRGINYFRRAGQKGNNTHNREILAHCCNCRICGVAWWLLTLWAARNLSPGKSWSAAPTSGR